MFHPGSIADWCRGRVCFVMLVLLCLSGTARADRKDPLNKFGWPLHDTKGRPINYDPEALAAAKEARLSASEGEANAVASGPNRFVPSGNVTRPFWQYPFSGLTLGRVILLLRLQTEVDRAKYFCGKLAPIRLAQRILASASL